MTELEQVESLGPVRPPGGSPRRRFDPVRAGVLAVAAVLMIVGVAAAMSAVPSAASGADPSADANATPAPAATEAPNRGAAPDRQGPKGDRPAWMGFGAIPFGDLGRAGIGRDITITAIDGSNLSLKTVDGWTRTIAITSSTTITKGGKTVGVGDLAVGDHIRFTQQRADDGTYSITRVVVVLPTVVGQVKSVNGDTITVTQPGGTTATIHVGTGTKFQIDGSSGSLSDVKVGSFVVAEGTQRSDGSLDAATVRGGDMKRLRGVPGSGRDHGPKPGAASPAPSSTTS
jgi:uncharacterized protein DUF5666